MTSGVLHHEVVGEGTPVVFIHGLGATSNVWFAQREVLSERFQVIVYDRSGCGLSSRRDEACSIASWGTELAGLLDDLAVESAVVVGHSLGSMVAQYFASTYPERTRALVLVGGEAALSPEGKEILRTRADLIEAHGLPDVVDSWLSSVVAPETRVANPVMVGLLRAMFLSYDPHSYAQQARALSDADVRPYHRGITCPTLLLVGDEDPVTPLAWQQAIQEAIPGSRLRIIPGTAHMPMLESPMAITAALQEFLAGLGASAEGAS